MTSIAKPAKGGVPTKLYTVLFGDTVIEYDVRRSRRRKKTVQIRVDGNGVHVAAPMRTTHSALRDIVLKQAAWILKRMSLAVEEVAPKRFVTGETLPYPWPQCEDDSPDGGGDRAGGPIRSLAVSSGCAAWS